MEEEIKMVEQKGGIALELILSKEKAETFECPICHGLVWEPQECSECSKLFCTDCIICWNKEHETCSICRKKWVSKTPINVYARAFLESTEIRCIFPNCKEVVKYDKLKAHEKECPNKPPNVCNYIYIYIYLYIYIDSTTWREK